MTRMMTFLANGKVVLGLEVRFYLLMLNNSSCNKLNFVKGGYNLSSISESVSSCVSVLLGNICPSLPPVSIV